MAVRVTGPIFPSASPMSIALRQQQLLQMQALGARQAGIVGRPGRAKRRVAGEAVGEVGDGERVGFGLIVGIDRVEVAEDEKARPLRPGRQQEAGLLVYHGRRLTGRAPSARRTPRRAQLDRDALFPRPVGPS